LQNVPGPCRETLLIEPEDICATNYAMNNEMSTVFI
jgi:hypothetical protein